GYYRPKSPEISSPIPVTTPEETTATSPAAQPPGSVTAAAVQLANLPATAPDGTPTPLQRDTAEFVPDTQTEANEPKNGPAVSPSPGPVRLNSQSQPAFGEVLLRAQLQTEANRPQKAPAASPLQGSPNPNSQSHPALEGELLLRALLWEYTRALPPSGEGA